MSPSDSFCDDGDDHSHLSPPTQSQNGFHPDEKDKREKMRDHIINEDEESKGNPGATDKLELGKEENSHKEGEKHYWRAIAELIPPEDSHSGGCAEPGKPIDLARIRQVSLKIRQSLLPHMTPPSPEDPKDEASNSNF